MNYFDKNSSRIFSLHRSKELPFVVPASLMQVLVAIGPPATLNTTGPYYVSKHCPGLNASCSPKTKNKGPAPAMKYQFENKHESNIIKHGFVTICGARPKYCRN